MKTATTYFIPEQLEPILEYIDRMWAVLTVYQPKDKGTLIGLPKPYIVPSSHNTQGFGFHEMFYWDSFFIAQGLYGTRHQVIAADMLDNLLYLQRRFGIIPNGNRYYFLSRSQPPFLTTYILDVYHRMHRSKKWLSRSMAVAESEYLQVWTSSVHPHLHQVHRGLSRFYDINLTHDLAEAASGWDMTPRFGGECLDFLPIDLNCLLFKYEKDFETVNGMLGRPKDAQMWAKRAYRRKQVINELMWDEQAGFYFDYNFVTGKRSPVWSLAAYFALWAGVANRKQATRMVEQLKQFQFDGGLATTNKSSVASTESRSLQWEYPNGWAPLQWITTEGLVKYGFREEADVVVRTWLAANVAQFNLHNELLEKYNVVQPQQSPKPGLYPSQEGFGWTNAVFYRLAHDYLLPQELPDGQVSKYSNKVNIQWSGTFANPAIVSSPSSR